MKTLILAASLALFTSLPAAGGLILTLTNSEQYGLPGSILSFSGYLTNNSVDTTDPDTGETILAVTLYPNGDDISLLSEWLTAETSLLLNAPLSVGPGMSSDSFVVFSLTIDPNFGLPGYDPLGLYTGLYSLKGGVDPEALVIQSEAAFTVHVVDELPTTSDTPEPAGAALLAGGIAMLAGARVLRSRRK